MFKTRKIKSQFGVGDILLKARYKTGLSLELIAKHIKISPNYLQSLEKEDWRKLPGKLYTKNFLKTYANFLKIDLDENIVDWEKIIFFKRNNYEFIRKTTKWNFFILPKVLKTFFISLIVGIILIYLIFQIDQIIQAPKVVLFYPSSDINVSSKKIIISGHTQNGVKIKINDTQVFLDKNNNFNQEINLLIGLNNIVVEGKKKYSKAKIIRRLVIVE